MTFLPTPRNEPSFTAEELEAACDAATLAERERCARIVEDKDVRGYVPDIGCMSCFARIAAAIRLQSK